MSNRAVLGLLTALDRGLCEHVCVCNRLMRVWRRGRQAEIELKVPLGSEVDQELGSAHLGVRVPPALPPTALIHYFLTRLGLAFRPWGKPDLKSSQQGLQGPRSCLYHGVKQGIERPGTCPKRGTGTLHTGHA